MWSQTDLKGDAGPKIPLTIVMGIIQRITLKHKGYLSKHNSTIVADFGSTPYLIDIAVAKNFNWFIYSVKYFKGMVAIGYHISGKGKCNKIDLSIHDFYMHFDYYALLVGVEMVLAEE